MPASIHGPASSTILPKAAEALRREAPARAPASPRGQAPKPEGAGQTKSFFERGGPAQKLDLTGEGRRTPVRSESPQRLPEPEPGEGPGLTPLAPSGTPSGIPVGTVSHQDGTVYSDNVSAVLAGEPPGANYCASTAFAGLSEAVPGWASEQAIHDVLAEKGTRSSIAIWDQLIDGGHFDQAALTPGAGVITEVALPDGQPIPVSLEVNGQALRFEVAEVEVRNDVDELTADRARSTLESLEDLQPGEVRAVMMRPLNYDGTSATTEVGHWVLVERTEDGYRLTQSAPEDWALLGGSAGTGNGGLYVHEFTGPDALQDVSSYVHAEAQYSAKSAGMYAVAVLTPVTEGTSATAP